MYVRQMTDSPLLGGLDDQGRRDLEDESRRHEARLRGLDPHDADARRDELKRHLDRLGEIARESARRMNGS